jgi:hypothetical protein
MTYRIEKNNSGLHPFWKFQLAIISNNFPAIRQKAVSAGLFVGEGPDYQGTIYSNSEETLQNFLLTI